MLVYILRYINKSLADDVIVIATEAEEADADFQELTPRSDKEFLECIVESGRDRLAQNWTTHAMVLDVHQMRWIY